LPTPNGTSTRLGPRRWPGWRACLGLGCTSTPRRGAEAAAVEVTDGRGCPVSPNASLVGRRRGHLLRQPPSQPLSLPRQHAPAAHVAAGLCGRACRAFIVSSFSCCSRRPARYNHPDPAVRGRSRPRTRAPARLPPGLARTDLITRRLRLCSRCPNNLPQPSLACPNPAAWHMDGTATDSGAGGLCTSADPDWPNCWHNMARSPALWPELPENLASRSRPPMRTPVRSGRPSRARLGPVGDSDSRPRASGRLLGAR
jgi:hypothetical protein